MNGLVTHKKEEEDEEGENDECVKNQKGVFEVKNRLKSDLIGEKRKQNFEGERWVRGSELDLVS